MWDISGPHGCPLVFPRARLSQGGECRWPRSLGLRQVVPGGSDFLCLAERSGEFQQRYIEQCYIKHGEHRLALHPVDQIVLLGGCELY